jgi:hypothetical protein
MPLENARLRSPRVLPWTIRPALLPLRPCVRLLGLCLRAIGSLSGRVCVGCVLMSSSVLLGLLAVVLRL